MMLTERTTKGDRENQNVNMNLTAPSVARLLLH